MHCRARVALCGAMLLIGLPRCHREGYSAQEQAFIDAHVQALEHANTGPLAGVRIGGYNDFVGQVVIESADRDHRFIEVAILDTAYRRFRISASRLGMFFADAPTAVPSPGQSLLIKAAANAKGHWSIHEFMVR